jgi:hypothetical protein
MQIRSTFKDMPTPSRWGWHPAEEFLLHGAPHLARPVPPDAGAALADGGQVQMPLAKTFFSSRFGMLADRFGVPWMVYVEPR